VDDLEETFEGAMISQERRYAMTSLDPSKVSPKKWMRLIRGHGHIENGLPLVNDRCIKDRW
jgi:hypothetical protein